MGEDLNDSTTYMIKKTMEEGIKKKFSLIMKKEEMNRKMNFEAYKEQAADQVRKEKEAKKPKFVKMQIIEQDYLDNEAFTVPMDVYNLTITAFMTQNMAPIILN